VKVVEIQKDRQQSKKKIRNYKLALKKQIQERNKKFLKKHLSKHPCVDCGEPDIIVLDFDHVRGVKKKSVSTLARNCASLRTLQEEIDKCDIRCANCHRRKNYNERLLKNG